MNRNNYIKVLIIFLLPYLMGCAEENILSPTEKGKDKQENLPIEFIFSIEDLSSSRAIKNPKRSFSSNDVIHVTGTFEMTPTPADPTPSPEVRYGAFYYNAVTGQWVATEGSELTWPTTAESATFEAYYIGGAYDTKNSTQNPGGLLAVDVPATKLLSAVVTNADPLHAVTSTSVSYGNAVRMNFTHLCTYLTLEDIRPMYSAYFYFSTDTAKIRPDQSAPESASHEFHNAFSLVRNNDNTLTFKFISQAENDKVYVSAPTVRDNSSGSELETVNFFLEPGYYDKFILYYPSSSDNVAYPYLYYLYTPSEGNTPPQLNAGTAYVLNIMNSPGITIDQKPEEGEPEWNETGQYYEVDVDAFLTAVRENNEYEVFDEEQGKNVTIIKKTSNGLELQQNVDFRFAKYILLKNDSLANVQANSVFDGGLNYIRNLGCPLFNENKGTVKNLGIKTITASEVLLDQNSVVTKHDGGEIVIDQSRKGGLCNFNRGTISNIRISDVTLSATVITADENDVDNIGCIIGSNTGSITQVRLSGNLSLKLENDASDSDGVNSTMNVGGLGGQNVGSISDVAPLEGQCNVSIINKCTGELGAFYVGGIVGYSTGYIAGISLSKVDIDASESICTKSFIGMITGEVFTSSGISSTLLATNIAGGKVIGGSIFRSKDLDSGSYIGGISGAIVPNTNNGLITISDCMLVVNMLDNSKANARDIINSTGGCYGRIYAAFETNTINLILNKLTYPSTTVKDLFYGTFAGLVPAGQSWTNYSGNNIIITNKTDIQKEIGGDKLAD